ncbi:response regulator transcription factor [Nitrospira sp. Nam74]
MSRKASTHRLLLVDDDSDCLTALSDRLHFAFRNQGLEVDMADSAATGLILAHAAAYDAMIVEVHMPDVSGFKFVEQLRHTQPHVPIIMISARDLEGCQGQSERLAPLACLPKPIEFSALVVLIHQILDDATPHHNVQRDVQHKLQPQARTSSQR